MPAYFRTEIAGLRAIAVIGVVLFHLKVAGVQGGFVGVDVFFVISGYLITRNILRDVALDRFSFGGFYVRRARRILPALIATVVLTYLAGALWCSPMMFLDLAKECTHALLSIANIQYWRESHQYFAANSDELALLHCWSLSLEEQFYLLWPLFIVLAKRIGRPFQAIAVAALLSLLSAIIVSKTDPLAAFFLMPFRIFEFATGALVLAVEHRFRPSRATAEGLSAGGILCIVASMLLFSSDMPHLEAAVLVPCLGAAATILAGDRNLVSRIITNRFMQAIGAISYSLYLVHWPIIFFARFIFGAVADTPPGMVTTTSVMLVVAAAMYVFVERRFMLSSPPEKGSLRFAAGMASLILGLAATTHLTFLSKGFAWRLPAAQAEQTHLQSYPSDADIINANNSSPHVGALFVGDSIMLEYEYGLRAIMRQRNTAFRAVGGAGCPILYGVMLSKPLRRTECRQARDSALETIEKADMPIIFAQLWTFYDDATIDNDADAAKDIAPSKGTYNKLRLALELTVARAVARGRRILLIGAQPDPGCPVNVPRLQPGPLPHAAQPPCPVTTKEAAERYVAPVDRALGEVAAKWPDRVTVLRPVDYFCDEECPVVLNGLWLYSNRTHLSLAGADHMIALSGEAFRNFLWEGEERR
jgi:peptidoglycan/LPS O-acetylase OafA/YrhL